MSQTKRSVWITLSILLMSGLLILTFQNCSKGTGFTGDTPSLNQSGFTTKYPYNPSLSPCSTFLNNDSQLVISESELSCNCTIDDFISNSENRVFGSNIYHMNSEVCLAAVHANVISPKVNHQGDFEFPLAATLILKLGNLCKDFVGSTVNGVVSTPLNLAANEATFYFKDTSDGSCSSINSDPNSPSNGEPNNLDMTAPTLVSTGSLSPAPNETLVGINSNIILRFVEHMQVGVGEILIEPMTTNGNSVDTTKTTFTINVQSNNLIISNNDGANSYGTVTVDPSPTATFNYATQYKVFVPEGAFLDLAGNPFAGETWYFTTLNSPDTTPPTLTSFTSLSPAHNALGVESSPNFQLIFNEPVQSGIGKIILTPVNSTNIRITSLPIFEIDITSATNSIEFAQPNGGGGVLSFRLPQGFSLEVNTHYLVTINTGVIRDKAGNNFNGITSTNWKFQTASYNLINGVLTGTSGNNIINGSTSGDEISGLAGNDTLNGLLGNDTLNGGEGQDILNGDDGNDTLYGGNGDDRLNGGSGIDVMDGGGGNDTYYVDSPDDVVMDVTSGTGGTDLVMSVINSYTLPDFIENARFYPDNLSNASITGNTLGNTIFSGSKLGSSYTINGGDITGTTNGVAVTDFVSFIYSAYPVTVSLLNPGKMMNTGSFSVALLNIENITGGSFADHLTGDDNNNTLNGGLDADTMMGGNGNDIYYVDNTGDVVTESVNSGTDLVYSYLTNYTLPANIESGRILNSQTGTVTLYGNSLGNAMYINSVSGAHYMIFGEGGNDAVSFYYVKDPVLVHLDITGRQTISPNLDVTLTSIENLYGSPFSDSLYGNSGNNTISANSGNDMIYGLDGDDIILGGLGDDTIDGGAGIDEIRYTGATSGITLSLLNSNAQNTVSDGYDTLTNIENVMGSNYNDSIFGNSGNNTLNGGTGSDALSGGLGNDTLIGGAGLDTLDGGDGNDIFKFLAIGDLTSNYNTTDIITRFEIETDKIDLSSMDADSALAGDQAFIFVSSSAVLSSGQVQFIPASNASGSNISAQIKFKLGSTIYIIRISNMTAKGTTTALTAIDFIL